MSPAFSSSRPFQFAPPPSFDGKNFEEFSFKFRAYLNLMNIRYGTVLKQIEQNLDTPIADVFFKKSDGSFDSELVQRAQTLQYVLVNICSGGPSTFLRRDDTPNGFEKT